MDTGVALTSLPVMATGMERPRTWRQGTAMHTEHGRTQRPGSAMDTGRLCQTGRTTVDHGRPMRLRCRHGRAWPCPIGAAVALHATVTDGFLQGGALLRTSGLARWSRKLQS